MKRPFAVLFIFLALGICFFYKIKTSYIVLATIISILVVLIIICVICNKKQVMTSNIILLIIIFLIGGFSLQYKINSSTLLTYKDKQIEIKGRVLDILKTDDRYGKYLFKVEGVIYDEKYLPINEKALLEVYGKQVLEVGNLINSRATVLQPRRNTNPGLFNYRLYLNTRDVFTKLRVMNYFTTISPKKNLSFYQRLTHAFSHKVLDTFNKVLDEKNSGIISSIFLGNDTYMDSEIENNFRELGLAHILAVSGLHIGIIAYFFIGLFKYVGLSNRAGKVLTILIIWSYGLFIGYPISVVRANIMFTLLIFSTLIHKKYDSLNILCFAGFIMLLYNPLWLFNVGFQLSFSATCAIILFNRKTNDRMINIIDKVLNKLSIVIGVQLGTLPVIAYHFNKISIVALIANTLLIPLISISVILGFILFSFSFVCINISIALGFMLNILLNIVNAITDIILKFPITSITLSSPNFTEVIIYYILLLVLYKHIKISCFFWNIKKFLFKYLLLYTIFILLLNNINNEISLEFLDVGQGDCTLIRFDHKAYLIDTGGSAYGDFDVGEKVVVPYLNKNGVKALDGVFISHFHEDHCQGLFSIMDNIKIKKIIIGPRDVKTPICTKIVNKADTLNIPIVNVSKGDKINLGKDFSIEVLSPSKDIVSIFANDENNLSLVFLLSAFDRRILFTGDIEKEVEEMLLNENDDLSIDILKVPHHGSNTSSTMPFIKKTNPKYAVIQVGENNFGHPDKKVIKRYLDYHATIFRNDNNGLVTFKFDNKKFEVSYYLGKQFNILNCIQKYAVELLFINIFILVSIYLSKLYLSIYNYDKRYLNYYFYYL